jgi:hypothetical protein
MTSSLSIAAQPGTAFPKMIEAKATAGDCPKADAFAVGVVLPSPSSTSALRDEELERHIADLGRQLEAAYKRFQDHGDPRARQEAIAWLQLQTEAIERRSASVRGAMERVIDEGVDFFQTEGARQRRMLIARGLA